MNPYSPPFFPSSTLLPPFHHHFPFILPTPYLYPSRIYFVPSQFGVTSSLQLLPPVKPEAQPACPPQKRRDVKRRDLSNPCANKKRSDIRNVPTRHFDFTRRGCHGWKTSVMIKNIPSKYTYVHVGFHVGIKISVSSFLASLQEGNVAISTR